MSFFDLLFLAAGGVVGSGWLLSAESADKGAGAEAIYSWIIGGVLMLLIAVVMLEMSTVAPKTGGLVFLPLQTSGPVLATVVACGLWIFYTVNPGSEAAAAVGGVDQWFQLGLVQTDKSGGITSLTWPGTGLAIVIVIIVAAVNLVGPRWFLRINNALTIFKIIVPLLIVAVLVYAWMGHQPGSSAAHLTAVRHPVNPSAAAAGGGGAPPGLVSVLTTVTGKGVIYAYLGFQGPLDFAGNVKRGKGRACSGESARLRRAVLTTLIGSILLYVALQLVIIYYKNHVSSTINPVKTPYMGFISQVAPHWSRQALTFLLHLDMIVSPAGTAMVFTYLLTREVAALSRAHLTHRSLQKVKYSIIRLPGARMDVFWLILGVDVVLSAILMVCFRGTWAALSSITSVLALIVYATPSVTLAALRRRARGKIYHSRRYPPVAEPVAFIAIAVIFFLAGWDAVWPAMAALTVGCGLLFVLPALSDGRRWYDANSHVDQLLRPRAYPSALSAYVLFGYFAGVSLVSLCLRLGFGPVEKVPVPLEFGLAVPVAVGAWFAFRALVRLSVEYMEEVRPTLPQPLPPD